MKVTPWRAAALSAAAAFRWPKTASTVVLAARPGPSKLATGSRGRPASARMPTITPLRCATSAAVEIALEPRPVGDVVGVGRTARPTRSGPAARRPGRDAGPAARGVEGARAELVEDRRAAWRRRARARPRAGRARAWWERRAPAAWAPWTASRCRRCSSAAAGPSAAAAAPCGRAAAQAPQPRDGADGDLVGVAFERHVGLGGARDARVRLLTDMRQLVREQRVADRGPGPVLAGRERDVLADRDRPRADLARDLRARGVVVHAYLGELAAEHAAELRADLGLQRPPAAQLVRERGGIVAVGRRRARGELGQERRSLGRLLALPGDRLGAHAGEDRGEVPARARRAGRGGDEVQDRALELGRGLGLRVGEPARERGLRGQPQQDAFDHLVEHGLDLSAQLGQEVAATCLAGRQLRGIVLGDQRRRRRRGGRRRRGVTQQAGDGGVAGAALQRLHARDAERAGPERGCARRRLIGDCLRRLGLVLGFVADAHGAPRPEPIGGGSGEGKVSGRLAGNRHPVGGSPR